MLLFSDQTTQLLNTFQSAGVKITAPRAIQAVNEAYRRIGSCHSWSYLHRRTQVNTVAPYSTGTIAFNATTRELTITTGTWPTWAGFGLVLISGNTYAVQRRVSNSVAILKSDRCPVANISSGTTYSLYRIEYVLPADFIRTEELTPIGQWWWLQERAPGSMLQTARLFASPSRPFEYTVRGSQQSPGRMAIEFGPPPDAAYTIDMSYFAQPRPRTLSNVYSTGTVSVSGTAVTGVGTAFASAMVGCQLRQGTTSAPPAGMYGETGSLNENTIADVTDATHLTLADSGTTSSGVQYVIDDPVDIDLGSMSEVFSRMCESQFMMLGKNDKRMEAEQEAVAALLRARAMDVRLSPRQQTGGAPGMSVEAMIYSGIYHQ